MGDSDLLIESFEDLENYIRTFTSWDNEGGYDFGGAVYLLLASLDNLRFRSLEAELDDIGEYMSQEQIVFLKKITALL